MPHRVIGYVDGFNLYLARCDLNEPYLKWLNLWSLSESLLGVDEEFLAVKYFSAYAKWLPGPYSRQREYVRALESAGVTAIMGRFKEKPRGCLGCGTIEVP